MNRKGVLWVDQWDNKYYCLTIGELCEKLGLSKNTHRAMMYYDIGGKTKIVGRVIGRHWLTAYIPMEVEA